MTDYTEVRMRISWVVLTTLVMAAASAVASTPQDQDKSLSAAVLSVTRALQDNEAKVPALLHFTDSDEGSQEYQLRGTTLVVKRRSKTPLLFGAAAVPPPVEIRSDVLSVLDAEDDSVTGGAAGRRSGRQLNRVGADGVVEITGVRVPDDESDRHFTWRNARVIKNMLVPAASAPTQRRQRQVDVTVLDQGPTGVRAPILQYAHPELGLQPALRPSTSRELEIEPQRRLAPQPSVYYAQENPQDIHNDHSPYQFEPAESLKEHRPFDGAADSRQQQQQQQQYEPKRAVRKPVLYKDLGDYEKYKIKSKWYSSAPAPIAVNNAEPMSYATFYAPQEPRPFWQRISEMIRDNVNSGYAQMASMARPVFSAATKAMGGNFAVADSNVRAQEKTGVAAPVVLGAAPFVVPAVGLVAGGAVLGLGAAAVSRLLETTQVVHSRRRRALLTGGSSLLSFQDQLAHDEDRIAFTNSVTGAERPKDSFLAQLSRYGHSRWREETPCAKRIFCDVMTQQPQDMSILMEKRISIFLSLLNESVARALSGHMGDVLDAVRKHDCSAFRCASEEHQIGVSVSGAAFDAQRRPGPRR